MVLDPDEHAKYCFLCDRPNYNDGDICKACEKALDQEDAAEEEDDMWGGTTLGERVDYLIYQVRQGNLEECINFLMHDGDVRVESVKLALCLYAGLIDERVGTNPRHTYEIQRICDNLITLIDTWEKT